MQNIALVLGMIQSPQEFFPPILRLAFAGVMARGEIVSAERPGMLEQVAPFDLAVADQTGIGGQTLGVAVQESLHHRGTEQFFYINSIEGDIENGSHAARLGH